MATSTSASAAAAAASAPALADPPPPSALQEILSKNNSQTQTSSPHAKHMQNLASQIIHNLQHQHLWTDIRMHFYSLTSSSSQQKPLSRPLISGLPPQRLYIHPDEQIALLQAQKEVGGSGLGTVLPEREWVCPSHLREKWSLRRFGEVFDEITMEPPEVDDAEEDKEEEEEGGESHEPSKWRTTKRILLATVDDDSTIVYYIVHDGIVKPRQN